MFRCPHCGSTAQVKTTFAPTLSDNEKVLTEGFECGCGCHFTTEYYRGYEGAWTHRFTNVEWIERREE